MGEIDGLEGGRLEGVTGERAKVVVRKVYEAKPAEAGELTELHGLNAVVRQVQDLGKFDFISVRVSNTFRPVKNSYIIYMTCQPEDW